MTINEIISHKWSALELYNRLKPTTIQLAAKEELTLRDLCRQDIKPRAPKQSLPTGRVVSYGGALCFYCVQTLVGLFNRTTKPDIYQIEYMAGQMVRDFSHWTVADLPTFVSMCIGARLPSQRTTDVEYEMVILDIPSIMGKVESYNKMRPNPQALQGGSPEKATEKELTDWHKTHLMDGTPYVWTDMDTCKKYWRDNPNKDDTDFKKTQESLDAQTKGGICKDVNQVLKIRKNAQEPNV